MSIRLNCSTATVGQIPDYIPLFITMSNPVPTTLLFSQKSAHSHHSVNTFDWGSSLENMEELARHASKLLLIDPKKLIVNLRLGLRIVTLFADQMTLCRNAAIGLVEVMDSSRIQNDDGSSTKFYRIEKNHIYEAQGPVYKWFADHLEELEFLLDLYEIDGPQDVRVESRSLDLSYNGLDDDRRTNIGIARSLWKDLVMQSDRMKEAEDKGPLRDAFLAVGCNYGNYEKMCRGLNYHEDEIDCIYLYSNFLNNDRSQDEVKVAGKCDASFLRSFVNFFPGSWSPIGPYMYSVINVELDSVTEIEGRAEMMRMDCISRFASERAISAPNTSVSRKRIKRTFPLFQNNKRSDGVS